MIKQNLAFDYRYDWVIAREQRLEAALAGTSDPSKVLIPVNPNDIATGTKSNSKAVNCMQPLPFFTSIHQAASFMGRSRRAVSAPAATEDGRKRPTWLNSDQDAFLLAPKKVTLPVMGVDLEFEIARSEAPEEEAS
jgi:casein kinase 1 alpha